MDEKEKNYLNVPSEGATDKVSAYAEAGRRWGIHRRAQRENYETTHAGIVYQGGGGVNYWVRWRDLPAAK